MGRVILVGFVPSIFEVPFLFGSLAVFTAFIVWCATRVPNRQELALGVISCSVARSSSSARKQEVGGRVA
jgi:hypothetical protein